MFAKQEERSTASDKGSAVARFCKHTLAVAEVELIKLLRDPTELFTRAVQPVLWIVIFGQVFSRARGVPTGNISYLAFMTPGILAQSVLFSAIFYGIAVIWERDLGILHKMLVSPAYRAALVLGKALSSGLRGISQTIIIYLIALVMHIPVRLEFLAITEVLFAVVLGSAIFSTFSLIIACVVKTRERFMGIGQVMTMPLFFASNAIYPLELMPRWLRVIALGNPLTYLVDALRGLMITGGVTTSGYAVDFAVLAVVFLAMLATASRIYQTLAK